jgi:signal transduction histidine kinase
MIQKIKNEIVEVKEKIRVIKQASSGRALTAEEECDLEELEMDLEDLCNDLVRTIEETAQCSTQK